MKTLTTTLLCSAFPGTGKSYFFNNSNMTTLDSDSSQFDKSKFPDNYITHIKENIGNVDIIFISSHEVVRTALIENKLNFLLIYPYISLKDEYIQRYKERGSSDTFINLINTNWDNWISQLQHQEGCKHLVLQSGQYISDVL